MFFTSMGAMESKKLMKTSQKNTDLCRADSRLTKFTALLWRHFPSYVVKVAFKAQTTDNKCSIYIVIYMYVFIFYLIYL